MKEVHDEVEKLFWWKLEHHFSLGAIWWDTHANFRADGITRTEVDGDWRLSREGFLLVWARWGPFDMDLMASSVSVQRDLAGQALPFFSRFRSPGCAGINVLAQVLGNGSFYCFPPAQMIGPVVCHLANLRKHMRLVLIEKTMPRAVGSWATREPCVRRGNLLQLVACPGIGCGGSNFDAFRFCQWCGMRGRVMPSLLGDGWLGR